MVRIRTIKPEFWSDEKLSTLTAIDRLVFLGLIGMSDDYGRLHDNVKVIDAFVFPNSSETVRESLANLSRTGRIRRGKASNGKPVIEIANWSKHQRVDKPQNHLALPPIEIEDQETKEKPSDSFIPESFQNDSRIVPESFAPLPGTRDQGSRTKDQGERADRAPSHAMKVANFVSKDFRDTFDKWRKYSAAKGKYVDDIAEEMQIMALQQSAKSEQDAIEMLRYTMSRNVVGLITTGEHRERGRQSSQNRTGIDVGALPA